MTSDANDGAPPALPETADWIAGHQWVEQSLFALTGRWSTDPSDPHVATFFASQSSFHGWRAGEWAARAPRSVVAEPAVPGDRWSAALEAAEAVPTPQARLAAWAVGLQAGLVVRYRRHLSVLGPVADAGVKRWCSLAVGDAVDGLVEGHSLLARRVEAVDGADAGAVAAEGGRILGVLWGADGT